MANNKLFMEGVYGASSLMSYANSLPELPSVLPDGLNLDFTAEDETWKTVDSLDGLRSEFFKMEGEPKMPTTPSTLSEDIQASRKALRAAVKGMKNAVDKKTYQVSMQGAHKASQEIANINASAQMGRIESLQMPITWTQKLAALQVENDATMNKTLAHARTRKIRKELMKQAAERGHESTVGQHNKLRAAALAFAGKEPTKIVDWLEREGLTIPEDFRAMSQAATEEQHEEFLDAVFAMLENDDVLGYVIQGMNENLAQWMVPDAAQEDQTAAKLKKKTLSNSKK